MSAYSDARYALWLHLSDNHGCHSLESELDEVIRLAVAVDKSRKDEQLTEESPNAPASATEGRP